jgi:hypothetical protein
LFARGAGRRSAETFGLLRDTGRRRTTSAVDLPTARQANHLTAADPADLADAIAYALRFHGRKRVHNADEMMSEIVAKRLLERAGFVVMKRPPEIGAAAIGRGFERDRENG